jgi:transposase
LITTTRPAAHALPGQRWTLRKILKLVALKWALSCHKSTLWLWLCAADLSWKKPKKILAKANTAKRLAYLAQFNTLYQEMIRS